MAGDQVDRLNAGRTIAIASPQPELSGFLIHVYYNVEIVGAILATNFCGAPPGYTEIFVVLGLNETPLLTTTLNKLSDLCN